jgi:hypothetical protein
MEGMTRKKNSRLRGILLLLRMTWLNLIALIAREDKR